MRRSAFVALTLVALTSCERQWLELVPDWREAGASAGDGGAAERDASEVETATGGRSLDSGAPASGGRSQGGRAGSGGAGNGAGGGPVPSGGLGGRFYDAGDSGGAIGAGARNGSGGIPTRINCGDSVQCPATAPHCDVSLQRCVQCLSPLHCPVDQTCDLVARRCARPCSSSVECDPAFAKSCDPVRHVCVECAEDADCNQATVNRFCETISARCVECRTSTECKSQRPYCDPFRLRCDACESDEQCPPEARCNMDLRECVDRH